MHILTREEGKSWLAANNLSTISNFRLSSKNQHNASYKIPADSGRKYALAFCFINFVFSTKKDTENCLWINEFGVFPNCEDHNLFDGFRNSLGENRSLSDTPFHIFTKDDSENITSILSCVLYFFWDCFLISKTLGLFIHVSHHEIFDLAAEDESEFKRIQDIFLKYQLIPVK